MNKILQILLLLSVIISLNCKEQYYPELDAAQKTLVVDALLSDQSKTIVVRLNYAIPFGDQTYLPAQLATVVVSDDNNKKITFTEKSAGVYESNNFSFDYGRTYTLVIKTQDSKLYKSSPQTLFPKSEMESVNHNFQTKKILRQIGPMNILSDLNGLEFSVLLNQKDVSSPFFRFSNTLLVSYTENWVYKMPQDPEKQLPFFYCWQKFKPNQSVCLSTRQYNNTLENQQILAFCPVDTNYYSIVKELVNRPVPNQKDTDYIKYRRLKSYAISFTKYHLNEDIYEYYKELNNQIEAKQRIFDPISFQIRGNITCENSPDEPVLGVFEVSSTNTRTYIYNENLSDMHFRINEINPIDIDNIPISACNAFFEPGFWSIFNTIK